LTRAAAFVRAQFGGQISYASLPFEHVDWTLFDFISTDAGYRSAELAERYRNDTRTPICRGNQRPHSSRSPSITADKARHEWINDPPGHALRTQAANCD
jgi:hypothetical protein